MSSPAFGQADLTNCERELIHLAGSVQPHGVLLVLAGAELKVLQTTANADDILGHQPADLLGHPLSSCGGNLAQRVHELADAQDLSEPLPLQASVMRHGHAWPLEGTLHRLATGDLVLELEPTQRTDIPCDKLPPWAEAVAPTQEELLTQLSAAVQRFSNASTIGVLADATVQCVRDLTGYDRVMVYKFDPDGHGKIIAEARDPRLDTLLNHRYPASDIPQRARELYLRNRVRVLVDVHYTPAALVPGHLPTTGTDLDMSLCYLRSMSPLHLQYLKNMGVTATLVVSLVREGQLWGMIAAHHYSPRNLRFGVRAAAGLLGEVISTRIAAIENYTHAQVAILVRRLEQRLVEATSTEGDWRLALFRNPRTLLQPLEATGAALFYDDEVLTSGEVPSTPELRALLTWVHQRPADTLFHCSSVARENPALDSLTPVASGVLAVKLSSTRPDYLMWFRKEQLTSVTWAGDPTKPVIGNDPMDLSPRRSFAAWSEIVRGTALPWAGADLSLARAIGTALVDIIVQVHAVRLLIAEHQLSHTRSAVEASKEPVVIADAQGRLLFSNTAFAELISLRGITLRSLQDVASLFTPAEPISHTLRALKTSRQPWRGELALVQQGGEPLPVSVRAEVVPGSDGSPLGFILIVLDQSEHKRAGEARRQLEESLSRAAAGGYNQPPRDSDEVVRAILTNASLAAMDIADAAGSPVATLLKELEASTLRATALYGQIRALSSDA